MAKISRIRNIDVSTASFPISLLLDSDVTRYKIYGTKALSVDVAINPSGTAKGGMMVMIDYAAVVTSTIAVSRFGDYKFDIFGTKVPYSWLAKKLKIWCEYHNSAWDVFILPSIDSIPNIKLELIDTTDLLDGTTMTYDGTTGKVKVKDAGISATQLATNAVEEAKIKAKAVSLGKMADLARGSIIVGGASDAPTALSAKTSARILIGDGTDVVSLPISGDVTIDATGAVSIGADKILAAMIKAGEIVAAHLSAAAAVAFTQMAALTASKIPVLNASGFIEAGTVAATKLSFLDVTTAGTAEASKAVVLSAAKKIDELDITTLKKGGTTVNASADEMNYLVGVTGLIQAQIDAAASKQTHTEISVNTIATAATLYQAYIMLTASGTVLLTLPDASTVDADTIVEVIQKGGNIATVSAHAAQVIQDNLASEALTLACSGNGGGFKLICDGVDTWKVVSYT